MTGQQDRDAESGLRDLIEHADEALANLDRECAIQLIIEIFDWLDDKAESEGGTDPQWPGADAVSDNK